MFPRILLLCLVAIIGCDIRKDSTAGAPAQPPASMPATTSFTASDQAYDVLTGSFAPYTSPIDPLAFPMKARNLSTNTYRFWRGSKELFYIWCKAHTADWLADDAAYLRIHGDLHPGNIGTYPAPGKLGRKFGFGAVDFDDSARLPFQLELLEGVVTFQLLARHSQIKLDAAKSEELLTVLLDAYRTSLLSSQDPADMLASDKWVSHLLKEAHKRDYADEIDKYTHGDRFTDKKGNEILRPITDRTGFAQAIREAMTHAPRAAGLLDRDAILDIAQRTQLESAGSVGLEKYLVLVSTQNVPGGKVLLYLKQQIPSSAERVGLIPRDPRSPAQRCSEDLRDLSRPDVFCNGWCTMAGKSFRLSLKEPWSETLGGADDFKDLVHLAQIWGTVAGSVHRQGPQVIQQILQRLTPQLKAQLRERANSFVSHEIDEFRAFTHDSRTRALVKQADTALKELP